MPTEFARSSRPNARFTGIIYLLYFVTAIGGELLLRGIVIPGNADSTASDLIAHPSRFQVGVAIGLASTAAYLALTGLFYRLFAPVNRYLSAAAAFFSIVGCAILATATLFAFCPSHYSEIIHTLRSSARNNYMLSRFSHSRSMAGASRSALYFSEFTAR
jgi:hypothetical protein